MRRLRLFSVSVFLLALAAPAAAEAAEQTLVLRSKAITMQPYEVVQDVIAVPSPKVDGYITGMSADVVDAAGNVQSVHAVMLHHAVFLKAFVPDLTCPTIRDYEGKVSPLPAERFYGTGEERGTLELPAGYGYPNRGSDIWALVYMLMNHRNSSDTVYVQYRVRYVTGEPRMPVKLLWLDVRNCNADPVYTVPGTGKRRSTHARVYDFRMPEGGRIVSGGGHLHGGGVRLDLENASCGTTLFRSEPTWGGEEPEPVMHEPGPSHMTSFAAEPGIPVAAGETLRLRSVYDNSRPHVRVMGILLLYFAPGTAPPCAPAPALPPDPASRPAAPPRVVLPLLKQPRGPLARGIRSTWVGDYRFGHQRVSIKRGTTFRWRFVGSERHDVTLANGPEGFASPSVRRGTYTFRFRRPGVYNLFCSLHPTHMTQRVIVR